METRILGVAKNPGTRHMLRGALSVARQAHISKVDLTELFEILMKFVCVGREVMESECAQAGNRESVYG